MAKTSRGTKSQKKTSRPTTRSPSAMRKALDKLDSQLISLLAERAQLVLQLEKKDAAESGAQLRAQQRAFELIRKSKQLEGLSESSLQAIMGQVVGHCLAYSMGGKTAYLGPEYSYSHLAAIKCFGDSNQLVPVATIEAVFDSIVRKDCARGIVPVENSTDGRVVDTLGMFVKHRVKICGEVLLPIHHNLLSRTPRADIREVYSKPQAISQCRLWLAQNLPDAKLVEMSSSAAAARLAAERPGTAAVASLEAGVEHGLDVLAASIEDNKSNVTRFAVLGYDEPAPTGSDKTAILFQVNHEPGALADSMQIFKRAGLNLTWIESFPLPGKPNEYLFFMEFEGHTQDDVVKRTLDRLRARAERLELLGSYPRSM